VSPEELKAQIAALPDASDNISPATDAEKSDRDETAQ